MAAVKHFILLDCWPGVMSAFNLLVLSTKQERRLATESKSDSDSGEVPIQAEEQTEADRVAQEAVATLHRSGAVVNNKLKRSGKR